MGKFSFIETGIEGMLLIEPTVFGDERGYFMETYNEGEFDAAGFKMRFVQDNESRSRHGVLRGLHMQVRNPQGKLVRVIEGEVFDVGVDMRAGSPTLGKWYGALLSRENKRQLFIPEGFAHGFAVLSDYAAFVYKCTRLYDPADELGVSYDDPDIGIEWPDMGLEPLLSEKDKTQPSYKEVKKILGLE
ncbi:MAG: dTDP-4-dehydrorhamnose 3,5-epimerase [Oscillospiraceae bacterium]|nr:dTDP-4-dehydrorhamnose 3,5-epimerase [Oscillospiraceae bacterium]